MFFKGVPTIRLLLGPASHMSAEGSKPVFWPCFYCGRFETCVLAMFLLTQPPVGGRQMQPQIHRHPLMIACRRVDAHVHG